MATIFSLAGRWFAGSWKLEREHAVKQRVKKKEPRDQLLVVVGVGVCAWRLRAFEHFESIVTPETRWW